MVVESFRYHFLYVTREKQHVSVWNGFCSNVFLVLFCCVVSSGGRLCCGRSALL